MIKIAKAKYTRQSSIINIKDYGDNNITIIGCGAIGSFTSVSLAKMGLTNFTLYDMDTVEEHNLPNQFFMEKDVSKLKTVATTEHMMSFNSDCNIKQNLKFTEKTKLSSQIVISCVDKMDVRKLIFQKCKENKNVQLLIDGRMGGLQGQLYTVNMTNKQEVENYEKSLFGNKDAVSLRCTERSIIFTVLGIASLICNQIVKALNGDELSNYIVLDYSVPQMM